MGQGGATITFGTFRRKGKQSRKLSGNGKEGTLAGRFYEGKEGDVQVHKKKAVLKNPGWGMGRGSGNRQVGTLGEALTSCEGKKIKESEVILKKNVLDGKLRSSPTLKASIKPTRLSAEVT